MAKPKTNNKKYHDLQKTIDQCKAQQRAILAREKADERKARTKRLIEIGAEVEAALGYALDDEGMRKALGDFLRRQNANGGWANKAIQAGRTTPKTEE